MNKSQRPIEAARTSSIDTPSQASSAASSTAERDDRRRADPHAVDAVAGAIVEIEGEWRLVAEPAGKRRAGRLQMARRDIDEGRRAGAAVQIFVGAADSEISTRA